jgi:uncharacterized protein (TIGR03437 family)
MLLSAPVRGIAPVVSDLLAAAGRMRKLLVLPLVLFALSAGPAAAQGWDTSGNALLKGSYYFREVFYIVQDYYGDLSRAIALYGQVTFDGNGNYTMNAMAADSNGYGPQPLGAVTGTYSIAASGYGYLSNPLSTGDYVYGLVSKQGYFVGSSTESGFNDLFVAAPLSTQTTLASFKGSYWLADMDLSSMNPLGAISAVMQMSPDGAGNLGTVSVTGYAGQGGTTQYTQTISRPAYVLSNSAFSLSLPIASNGLISGQKFLYISPDGNFVFGGSPLGWDFFVGVRTGSGTPNFGGLFYQAGIDQPLDSNGVGYLDTYYGALNGSGGSAIGHQRLANALASRTYDYTYGETYTIGSGGAYSDSYTRYAVDATGSIRVGSGKGPYLGLNVAVAAPTLSGSGVFLNPEGVVNAGSWAPFTAGIAPGEFIVLNGAGLAPDGLLVASSAPFPTQLGPVQVMINGVAAPLYYATPTAVVAIVPYGLTGAIAQIQVINNGVTSNTVTSYISLVAPGVFTQTQNGLGYGAIEHADYSVVTSANPAKPGETLTVYLTGLGAVSPTVADGDAAPSGSLSSTTNTVAASIGGQTATVSFAGLTPGSVALYQVNVVVPTTATSGDNLLEIDGVDASSAQALIPVGTASTGAAVVAPRAIGRAASKVQPSTHRLDLRQQH